MKIQLICGVIEDSYSKRGNDGADDEAIKWLSYIPFGR